MATAAELLAGETVSNDVWFEVDLLSRQIIIPPAITNLGAKSDSDVMHAHFRLPRFYHDIDFADFEMGIDYTNANGEEDRYEPKDVTVGDDVVTFTWVIGRHAALYAGDITFGICAKRLNAEDPNNPLNEFHTTMASLPILDAMETCEELIRDHADILEQWRNELFAIVKPFVKLVWIDLPSSAWEGDESPYSQVVTIDGVTPYTKVDLLPSIEQLAIFHEKDLSFVTENDNGVVTVYALGDKPANDYFMQAQITEVTV